MKYLLLPPASLLLLFLAGLLLLPRRRSLAWILIAASFIGIWVLSTPFVATRALSQLQIYEAVGVQGDLPSSPQAIVVLSAGLRPFAPESGAAELGPLSLERLRYAARLVRRSNLPILLSGGSIAPKTPALAEIMARTLERDFKLKADWQEVDSSNTHTNAVYSAKILKEKDIRTIFLVTHAWHMPRAKKSFERAGLEVVPAPMGFAVPSDGSRLRAWIPSAGALQLSSYALHEWIGTLWYWISHDLL